MMWLEAAIAAVSICFSIAAILLNASIRRRLDRLYPSPNTTEDREEG